MKYKGTLIAVRDMERAKRFYRNVLGLEVVDDFGANVVLTGGIFLQTADTWTGFIRKEGADIIFENNASELYFETDDMDGFARKLETASDMVCLHPVIEHSWGQRAVRFYDADGHIIEVGENIAMVMKRFLESGLSAEETAKRMDVPIEYIQACMNEKDGEG